METNNIEITSGIPITKIVGRGRKPMHTKILIEMNVGDSFSIPATHKKMWYSASYYCGVPVTIRAQSDGTMRVWKVKKEE